MPMTAAQWNERYPVGTPVFAWPLERDDDPLITRTRTPAWTLGGGHPVVSVDGYAGGIWLEHIAPRTPDAPTLTLVKVIRTCFACPSQWDAWTEDGTYVYLRYRHGHGTVDAHWQAGLDDYAAELVAHFSTGDDGGYLDLDEFIAYVADTVQLAPDAEVRDRSLA